MLPMTPATLNRTFTELKASVGLHRSYVPLNGGWKFLPGQMTRDGNSMLSIFFVQVACVYNLRATTTKLQEDSMVGGNKLIYLHQAA